MLASGSLPEVCREEFHRPSQASTTVPTEHPVRGPAALRAEGETHLMRCILTMLTNMGRGEGGCGNTIVARKTLMLPLV